MIHVIGTPCIDFIAPVPDSFLIYHGFPKGRCTTIDLATEKSLFSVLPYTKIPGGSGANIAAVLALLDGQVSFTGPFGDDETGHLARSSLTSLGIECAPAIKNVPNQIVYTFLTDDGDRTFACYYNPDITVSPVHMPPITAHDDIWVITGYNLLYPLYADMILDQIRHFSGHVVFCPNDTSVIEEASFAARTLYERAETIIMNQTEAEALLHTHKTETLLQLLQQSGKSGALTLGADGADLFTPHNILHVPSTLNPGDFIDSNGAGDAFTAGCVYGLARGYDREKTGQLASCCASAVLSTSGARPPFDLKDRVLTKMSL